MSDKDYRPYTIPYTGSSAVPSGDSTFTPAKDIPRTAPQAAHPPAPQDIARSSRLSSPMVTAKPASPQPPLAHRRDSQSSIHQAIYSTSKNDAARRSSVVRCISGMPSGEIPTRFRSASNVSGTCIMTPKPIKSSGGSGKDSPSSKESASSSTGGSS